MNGPMNRPMTRSELHRKPDKIRWGTVIYAVLLFALFLLASSYENQPLQSFDRWAGDAIRGLRTEALTMIAKGFDILGSTVGFAVITLVFAGIFFRMRRPRDGVLTVAATAGAWGLNALFKNIFERDRPQLPTLFPADGYSFPSGNATIGAALIGFIAIALLTYLRPKNVKLAIGFVACLLIIALGLFRIYAGVHYPTDMIGGYFLGLSYLMILTMLRVRAKRKQQP